MALIDERKQGGVLRVICPRIAFDASLGVTLTAAEVMSLCPTERLATGCRLESSRPVYEANVEQSLQHLPPIQQSP